MRIAFVCNYSTKEVRDRICNNSAFNIRKLLGKIGISSSPVFDFAPWIPELIKPFENDQAIELHIVCLHAQTKKRITRYISEGIHYHFVSADLPLFLKLIDRANNYLEHTDYKYFRKKIRKEINYISPNLICVCGAENPTYSVVALENFNCPVVVILQTLLNSSKRREYNFGSEYRRILENRIASKVNYFLGYEPEAPSFIAQYNKKANCMRFMFPSTRPNVVVSDKKEFDFVFYAGGLAKFKGIEDAIDALALVKQSFSGVKMDIIGGCGAEYLSYLNSKIEQLGLRDNVHFNGFFPEQYQVFEQVAKARCVLVPGITAPLNATVREAMFLGMPTIVYENSITDTINKNNKCLLAAKMENIEDLASKMIYTLKAPSQDIETIAQNGKLFAEKNFTSEVVGERLKMLYNSILNNYLYGEPITQSLQYY